MTTPSLGLSFGSHAQCEAQMQKTDSHSVLTNRYFNKGTAFTMEEREFLGITARVPAVVETIDEQVARCMMQFDLLSEPINKYQLLANIHAANTTLYYAILCRYAEKCLPIIYTPTVGEACSKFGGLYQRERGLFLPSSLQGKYREMLSQSNYADVDIIVITDGSRILGLGDLGAGGMGISLGKCSLYIVGAGLMPSRVLPVLMDTGTNNKRLLADPNYLGQRIPRENDEVFYKCLDEFMEAASTLWPKAVIQFEDFSNNHCFDMLERYQKKYRCFNDDIQGTGAVVSAGFLNAIDASGISVLDQRILVFGAGSAAVGVALAIADLAAKVYGVAREEVIKRFYLIDTKGLVTTTRGDKLASHKVALARTDFDEATSKSLSTFEAAFAHVKPTAFLGLGGVGPVLTKDLVDIMLTVAENPIIFPLSNPTSKSEVSAADAYTWTNGKAIVATGSPYPSIEINGKVCKPSQGNNMYVFPGLGLGASLAQPTYMSDDVILAAAACLQKLPSDEDRAAGMLYPPIASIRNVSKHIAAAVVKECQKAGLGGQHLPTDDAELLAYVEASMWKPVYAPPMKMNKI